MLGRVVVENGVKKIVPLTADCGSGNPCGAIITVYQRTVPNGYLPLGAQYDIAQFPVLYSILGTDTIPTASALGLPTLTTGQYVIKATSGINENQADNVLSALSPVDVVALNNVHSVTSNAVAQALLLKAGIETGSFSLNFPRSTVQTLSGSYVKIGGVVFANVRVQVTATTSGNDYVNLPSNVPAMNALKGCFGSWRTDESNGYGTIQNSGTSSIWFIYNNQEFNAGQKAIDGGGILQIELMYFT